MTQTTSKSHFRALLAERTEDWALLDSRIGNFREPKITSVAREVERIARDLEPSRPEQFELNQIRENILASWKVTQNFDGLSRRELASVPWTLFYPRDNPDNWLANDEHFLASFFGTVESLGRRSLFARLLQEFVSAYPEERRCFEIFRRLCIRLADHLPNASPSDRRWKDRADRLGLLAHDAPDRIVSAFQSTRREISHALEEEELVATALGRAATRSLIDKTGRWIRSQQFEMSDFEWALEWIRQSDAAKDGKFRLRIPEMLLEPYAEHRPSERMGELLKDYFSSEYGDPRFRNGPRESGWSNVPDSQRAVITRMLVSVALEDFFKVLDRTALDRHWKYRRSFWNAYLESDLITDAWVVFGHQAQKIARSIREDSASSSANLRSGDGVKGNQSVLLMKIGGLTIAEWSHDGACHFWLPNNRAAPRLYQPDYHRRDVRSRSDHNQTHQGSENYRWQNRIADWIRGQVGAQVSTTAYRLRKY